MDGAKVTEMVTLVDSNCSTKSNDLNLRNRKKRLWDLISFGLFLLQTSSVVLFIRYSRMQTGTDQYSKAAIIASAEIGKICIGIIYCLYDYTFNQSKSAMHSFSSLHRDVFGDKNTLFLMAVPSLAYCLQNFLLFLALGHIESSIYQIIIQLKTFTTACFGICLLRKKYTYVQWISFAFLSVGVIIANFSVLHNDKNEEATDDKGYFSKILNAHSVGLMYALGTTITSGFAGTWMEMQLKGNKQNIFVQNIQLSLFALIGCVISGYFMNDVEQILLYGFFYGFNWITWIIIALNVFGGYFVAIVIKRASTMIKTFLSGIAILLIIVESYLFLGDQQIEHQEFIIAVSLVLLANYLYSKERENQRRLQTV